MKTFIWGTSILFFPVLAAFSSSTNYQLKSYGVNSGGTNNSSSSTYSLQAGTGETSGSGITSSNYKLKSGSIEAQQANVPGAPTLSNGSGSYTNKLNFIISTSSNPSDATYVVAVSTTSNFASVSYVQSDGTLAGNQVFQTYSQWGGSSGSIAVGLTPGTAYWFKAAAIAGKFTASGYGPSATISTANLSVPALSFSVSPNTLNYGKLSPGVVTNSPSNLSFSFTTNASFGGSIYMAGSYSGLKSQSTGHLIKIPSGSSDLSFINEGFGFQGLSANSPLSIVAPYNVTSTSAGSIYTTFKPVFSSNGPVGTGNSTGKLLAKSSAITPAAGDYGETLTYIAAASF